MPQPDQPTLRVRSAHDLISLIPFLIGHHPSDSLVLIAFDATRLLVTMRLGLHATDQDWRALAAHAARHGANRTQLLGYGTSDAVRPVLARVQPILGHAGLAPETPLHVDADRFYGIGCSGACCPADGTPLRADTDVVLHAITTGMVALPDRDALTALVAPDPTRDTATMQADVNHIRSWLDLRATPNDAVTHVMSSVFAAAEAVYHRGDRLNDPQVAALTVVLADMRVRDTAITCASGTPACVSFWTDMTRRVLPGHVAEPACILALAALLAQRTPLATVALERALDADPQHTLAQLLRSALQHGMPPADLARIQNELRTGLLSTDTTDGPAPGQSTTGDRHDQQTHHTFSPPRPDGKRPAADETDPR